MIKEAEDVANLIEENEEAPTLFEEDIPLVKKEENNIVSNTRAIKDTPRILTIQLKSKLAIFLP